MAGDWVKMRSSLLANPKVHAIAKAIGRNPAASPALTTGFSGPPGEVLSRHALRHVCVTALLCVSSAGERAFRQRKAVVLRPGRPRRDRRPLWVWGGYGGCRMGGP